MKNNIGHSPSGKAQDFDSCIHQFKSDMPCSKKIMEVYMEILNAFITVFDVLLAIIFVSASKSETKEIKITYAVIAVLMMANILLIWR